jgi:hypothetical protein
MTGTVRCLFLMSILVIAPITLTAGEPLFQTPIVDFNIGSPSAIALGDLRNNGRLDIVLQTNGYPKANSYSVMVMFSARNGTFHGAGRYEIGSPGTCMALADLNGDGNLDIVVGTTDGYSVLLGNGDGTFQKASNYSLGTLQNSVAIADFNNDGKPDLVFSIAGNAGVLLGNGDGTFGPVETVYFGSAGTILAADMTLDGNQDLVADIASIYRPVNSGAIEIAGGNGNGTFNEPTGYNSGGFNGGSITIGDLNHDGYPDVVAANICAQNNCKVSTVGVIVNGNTTLYGPGGFASLAAAIADVNGDGNPDIIVINSCNNEYDCIYANLSILLGKGDGSFSYSTPHYNSGLSGAMESASIATGDVNGDGIPDLFLANPGGFSIMLSLSPSTITLTSTPNPSMYGQDVSFLAQVTSRGPNQPTGKVSFKNGNLVIGTAILTNNAATLTRKNLPPGSLTITATYEGDGETLKGVSNSLTQVVNPVP